MAFATALTACGSAFDEARSSSPDSSTPVTTNPPSTSTMRQVGQDEADCLRREGLPVYDSGVADTIDELNARLRCQTLQGWNDVLNPVLIEAFCEELEAKRQALVATGGRLTMTETIDSSACDSGEEPPGFEAWQRAR